MRQFIPMIFPRWRSCVGIALVACSLGACANLPDVSGRPPSKVLADTQNTALARAVRPKVAKHPGQSGFHLLSNGEDAFAARIILADEAEVSLDVQYYISQHMSPRRLHQYGIEKRTVEYKTTTTASATSISR
jgi:hypothetical protein